MRCVMVLVLPRRQRLMHTVRVFAAHHLTYHGLIYSTSTQAKQLNRRRSLVCLIRTSLYTANMPRLECRIEKELEILSTYVNTFGIVHCSSHRKFDYFPKITCYFIHVIPQQFANICNFFCS